MKGDTPFFNNAASKSIKTVDVIKQVHNAHNMPEFGAKNSVIQNYRNGILSTERYYDDTGTPYLDIDYTNHGNSKIHPVVPHEHKIKVENGRILRERKGRAINR